MPSPGSAPFLSCAALSLALSAGQAQTVPTPRYQAQIVRPAYGIPHIQAGTFAGLGYGVGYSYAQDNLCLLADQVISVRGERPLYLGDQGTTTVGFQRAGTLDSDVFFKAMTDVPALRRAHARGSGDARALRGYAARANRFLRDCATRRRPPVRKPAGTRPGSGTSPRRT